MMEFSQAKHQFINDIQVVEGYAGFTEKQGKNFHVRILWKDKKTLDSFMESQLYRVFHGAILTLSKINTIHIINNPSKTYA